MITIKGLPYFTIKPTNDDISRCYGAIRSKKFGWILPAYKPFVDLVLNDLKTIEYKEYDRIFEEYNNTVNKDLNNLDACFVTEPLKHQKESLYFALERLSAAIFLSCGLGKSKIAIDYLRLLAMNQIYTFDTNIKCLILTPKTVIHKWLREFEKHGIYL